VSDIDTVVVNSLKALDPEWPIREADIVMRSDTSDLCQQRSLALANSITSSAQYSPFAERNLWNAQPGRTIIPA
jgi:hypothetical protein